MIHVNTTQSSTRNYSEYAAAVGGCCSLFVMGSVGYSIYDAGFVDGIMNVRGWCYNHPIISLLLFLGVLLSGSATQTKGTTKRKGNYAMSDKDEDENDEDIDPEAESRAQKAVGWLGTEWERRQASCPECGVSGFVIARIPGWLGSNRWKCCNCESEGEGSLDGIDGKATTRLQRSQSNLWIYKQHVVCQHCQIRGFVVFKTTMLGTKYRMCCNCEIKEELQ